MTGFTRACAQRMPAVFLVSILTLASIAGVTNAQETNAQELKLAPGAEVQNITPKPGYFTEPGVAINPANPQQVLVAYQDNAHVAYSFDAGKTFTVADNTPSKDYRVSGDVSITYDKQGHAFLCYIAFDRLGTTNYWAHGATRNGIFVRRSLDGGKTWEDNEYVVAAQKTEPGIPFEDKPYIVADNTDSRYAGTLYVGWTRWTLADSQILLSRSTDDGKTWSEPVEIDTQRGLPRDDNGANEGFSGVVGPDGTLYVVWDDGNHVVFTCSKDGGQTFKKTRNVIDNAPIMFDVEGTMRSNGFPVIDMDRKSGRLYVVWSDYRNGGVDVFCSTSANRGKSWTPAVRINSDPIHDGADHFFQWLAVDQQTGAANVVFYDRRQDPRDRKAIVALARSTDGGQTFQNYAWTTDAFDPSGVFMGDYTGLAALGGRVYGAWTEKPEARSRGTVVRVGVADFGTVAAP
ncbi:MAG TPA: sialidase family protein [Terriglobia bacterium]|nr:sialidase family protein [Terriglobia bacterium]